MYSIVIYLSLPATFDLCVSGILKSEHSLITCDSDRAIFSITGKKKTLTLGDF